jgi:hypothetical protein
MKRFPLISLALLVMVMPSWSADQAKTDKPPFDALVSDLQSSDHLTLARAAFAIAKSSSPHAPAALASLVTNEYVYPSVIGSLALATLNQKTSLDLLFRILETGTTWDKKQAIWILGRFENDSASDKLLPFLSGETWQHREYAAWALGKLKCKKAIPLLKKLAAEQPGKKDGDEADRAIKAINGGESYCSMENQPPWVLIIGKDIPRSEVKGNIMTLKNTEPTELFGFKFQKSDEKRPLMLTLGDPYIVYYGGDGAMKDPYTGEDVFFSSKYDPETKKE